MQWTARKNKQTINLQKMRNSIRYIRNEKEKKNKDYEKIPQKTNEWKKVKQK